MTIPVIFVDGIEIVELSSIPEPSRAEFEAFIRGRQMPVIGPAWARVSNISDQTRGIFGADAQGGAPDVELKSERLVPVGGPCAYYSDWLEWLDSWVEQ